MGIVGSRRAVNRMAEVACAVVVALVTLAGCASAPAPAPTTATPTTAPVFASDEEALAAATEAYANYLAVYDATWVEGGPSSEEYLALSTGNALKAETESIAEWKAKGWKANGSTTFDSIRLQSLSQAPSGEWHIRTYLCADSSHGDVVDTSGTSVVEPDRKTRFPMEVEFVTTSSTSRNLKISESNVWSGQDFC